MNSWKDQIQQLLQTNDWGGTLALLRNTTVRDRAQIRKVLPELVLPYVEGNALPWQSSSNAPIHQYLWTVSSPSLQKIFAGLSFACSTKKQAESFSPDLLEPYNFLELLAVFQPTWLKDYFQHMFNVNAVWGISYDFLLQLQERGHLNLAEEWIVATLPNLIIIQSNRPGVRREPQIQFERLEDHPITLRAHIWLLFSFESNIHWADTTAGSTTENRNRSNVWYDCFLWLIEEQKIDRRRVLTECLQAITMPFNQSLLNWFTGLFSHLQPQEEELLQLQTELFGLFHTPISKSANVSLGYLKKLAGHPDFKVAACISQIGILLLSETKSVVQSSLILLSKLAKKHPQHHHKLTLVACQGLGQNDLPLQLRSAKIILAYGDKETAELTRELQSYAANLRHEVKLLLEEWMGEGMENAPILSPELSQLPPLPLKQEPLPVLQSFEDFVFLASKVFDNHEPWHVDHFLAGLILYQSEIPGPNIQKLLPAFQRALELVLSTARNSSGLMPRLARGLIIYAQQLNIWHSQEVEPLAKLYEEFAKKDRQSAKISPLWYHRRLPVDQDWTHNDGEISPFAALITQTLHQLKHGIHLPLLSTPTHPPYWVSPASLIERLHQYQLTKQTPNLFDFQLAIARISLDDPEKKWKQPLQKLSGEWQRIFLFLLIPDAAAVGPFSAYELWAVAAWIKKQKTSFPEFSAFPSSAKKHLPAFLSFHWQAEVDHVKQRQFDYQQNKYVDHLVAEPRLKITSNELEEPLSIWEKAQQWLLPKAKQENYLYSIFQPGKIRKGDYLLFENIPRLFSLAPNAPELVLSLLIRRLLTTNTDSYSGTILNALEILLVSREPFGIMAHLLIAASLVNQDKNTRLVAAELWIFGIARGQMEERQLGHMLGKLEAIEYGPLKRLIDLMLAQWLNLSDRHNQALEHLLEACLLELPPKPIRNLRKLIEIYLETRQINSASEINPLLLKQLRLWETTAALSKFPQLYLEQST